MFIRIQGIDLNSELIKEIQVVGKTIVVTDQINERSIYYFKTSSEAKRVREELIKELNNGTNYREVKECDKPTDK